MRLGKFVNNYCFKQNNINFHSTIAIHNVDEMSVTDLTSSARLLGYCLVSTDSRRQPIAVLSQCGTILYKVFPLQRGAY